MTGLLVAVALVALVALAVALSKRVRHPEDTAGHGEVPADTRSERFYREADAPAGPDAEDPILSEPEPPPS